MVLPSIKQRQQHLLFLTVLMILASPGNAFTQPSITVSTTSSSRPSSRRRNPILCAKSSREWQPGEEEEEDISPYDRQEEEEEATTATSTTASDADLLLQAQLDSLSPQVSYFYLEKEVGLSEETMWKITTEAPSALGMTGANIRSKVETLRQGMDLSPQDIRTLLSKQPTLLHLSAKRNLKPKLKWIQSTLELSTPQLRQLILAQPSILTYAPAMLKTKFKFFTTSKGLGFTIEETRNLLLQEPRLWTASVKTGLLPRARFFLHEIEIPKDQLRLIIQKNPQVLLYSLEDNLAPKLIHYAIMTLHMDPATHLTKLLTTYPQILDYNLERHIMPITRYFLNELDFSAHEFRSILLKFPRVLTYSLQRIKHNVGYLRYGLELDADGVRRVLYQAPQVLGLDEATNLQPKIQFLQQELLTMPLASPQAKEVLRKVILGMPTFLNLSLENNLIPKVDYLKSMLQREVIHNSQPDALKKLLCETLVKKPALLGYSLENRIQPRLEQIVQAGLPPSSITIGISMAQPKFEDWLARRKAKKAKMALVWQAPSSTAGKQLTNNRSETKQDDPSGRIVHWTRERRKPT